MNITLSPDNETRTLRSQDVAELAIASGFPCISVLMPTQPGPRLAPDDLRHLRLLVAHVDDRLREYGVTKREQLVNRLDDEVRRAAVEPAARGLAVYVSMAVRRRFRLPQPVPARAVVESTFATRPLVSALHRTPPHAVLVLHPTCAHLYAVSDGQLRPAAQLDAFDPQTPWAMLSRADAAVGAPPSDGLNVYLGAVDRMLAGYRAEHPSPLVLAGSSPVLDRFCGVSRHLERLAGRIELSTQAPSTDLASASGEVIQAYLRDRREEALRRLEEAKRSRAGDVTSGIDQCWHAARFRKPALLLVEEGFVSPSEPTANGSEEREPERRWPRTAEVHDLVDDLMEQVILRGGQLALVHDGELLEHGRVALISRG